MQARVVSLITIQAPGSRSSREISTVTLSELPRDAALSLHVYDAVHTVTGARVA